ncbi:MAG TPA: family 43 glycosylhydrolase, partial [Longimicrobiales bacterium]
MQSAAGRRILTCLCGTLAVAWLAAPQALSQTGDIRRVHDPAIIRQGDTYYLFSTNDGIAIRRSTDLFHWERIGCVFEEMAPAWAAAEVPGVRSPWAPDIAYYNGKYYLYYSLSTFGSQRS